jgi:hypothetical protein
MMMRRIPDLGRLEAFHERHAWSNSSIGLCELEETLIALLEGGLDFLPQEIEHIESFWVLPDIDFTSAGFVIRLESSRRVHLSSGIGMNDEETALEVNIEAENIPSHLSHPCTEERLGTGWRDDVEVLNEFVELWR